MMVGDRVTYKGTDGPVGEVTDVAGDEAIVRWGAQEGRSLTTSHRMAELSLIPHGVTRER